MLIYCEKYVSEVRDDDDNVIVESRCVKEIMPFELEKVVRVRKNWNNLEVLLSTGDIVTVEDAMEIYYR